MTELARPDFSKLPWLKLDFMEERFLNDTGTRLHFAQSREQLFNSLPTIVFFHGVLRDWRSFYPLLIGLRGNANLVSIDFRGHGKSAATSSEYLVTNYVDDAVRLVNSLQHQVLLYGHSLGAMVALATAARIPERIKATILEDPPFATMGRRLNGTPLMSYFQSVENVVQSELTSAASRFDTTNSEARIQRLFEAFSNISVGIDANGNIIRVRDQRDIISRRFSAESLARIDPELLAPITAGRWLDGYELDSLLSSIKSKIVLLRADTVCGGMLTSNEADHVVRGLDGLCEEMYFPGVGHSMHWSKPKELTDQVLNQFSANQS